MDSAYRAEHVGSLLRPQDLLAARFALFAGKVRPEDLKPLEDEAVLAAVKGQTESGMSIITDGEMRRIVYLWPLFDSIEGYDFTRGVPLPWHGEPGEAVPQDVLDLTAPVVTQRLRLARPRMVADEAAFLLAHAGEGQVKVTLPSPVHLAIAYDETTAQFYPTREDLLDHGAELLANEAALLVQDGVHRIQLDSPTWHEFLLDPWWRADWAAKGVDLGQLLDAAIAAENKVLDAARSAGAVTGVHICRGNARGFRLADGDYAPIAEQVFSRLRCDRLLLEYTAVAGGFEPLRFVPADKIAVLGLVSTQSARLETREEILRRLDEAARFLPIGQLALSPQCGFASSFQGNPLSAERQWEKLGLVSSVAREVWN